MKTVREFIFGGSKITADGDWSHVIKTLLLTLDEGYIPTASLPDLQRGIAVILYPPKIKSVTISTVSPTICHEVMGSDAMILGF